MAIAIKLERMPLSLSLLTPDRIVTKQWSDSRCQQEEQMTSKEKIDKNKTTKVERKGFTVSLTATESGEKLLLCSSRKEMLD